MSDLATLELEAELFDRLKIDPLGLDSEFINCAANIAWLGAKHGAALREHLLAKIAAKKLTALYLIQARDDITAEQEDAQTTEDAQAAKLGKKAKDLKGKVTESMVEARAYQIPALCRAQEREAEAEVALAIAKTNLTAMLAKRDMLVQMGANVRAEMERDPTIRSHKAHQRREGDDFG